MPCLVGCYDNASGIFNTFEAGIASATAGTAHPRTKLDLCRIYFGSSNIGASDWVSTGGISLRGRINAGYHTAISWQPSGTWAQFVAGSQDSQLITQAQRLSSWDSVNTHYYAFTHEPERETAPIGTKGTSAEWRQALQHAYDVFRDNATPNWKFTTFYQYNTLATPSGAAAASRLVAVFPNRFNYVVQDWLVPTALDVLGIDGPYNYRGSVNGTPSGSGWCNPEKPPLGQGRPEWAIPGFPWYNPHTQADDPAADPEKLRYWSDLSVSMGGPANMIIGEYTCYVLNPATAYPPPPYELGSHVGAPNRHYTSTPQGASTSPSTAERLAWVQAWATAWKDDPRMEGVMWYERDSLNTGFANGRLSGGAMPAEPLALAAYSDIGNPTVVEPPPPDDFVPGVVSPMTMAKL